VISSLEYKYSFTVLISAVKESLMGRFLNLGPGLSQTSPYLQSDISRYFFRNLEGASRLLCASSKSILPVVRDKVEIDRMDKMLVFVTQVVSFLNQKIEISGTD
jgi:hypothetical protein